MSMVLFFSIFCLLLVIGTPIAVVVGGLSFLPSLLNASFPYTVESAVRSMFFGLNGFTLIAIPLFMLAGIIMARGGISEKLFDFFAYFIGNKTAGLPCAVVLTCLFYGAISGSSPATVSAVGAMSLPLLASLGYKKEFSTSIVTVAGGLGVIIPPSISYIVYSSVAETSPGKLFIAGIFPGLLIGFALMVCCYIHCKRHGEDKLLLQANYEKIHSKGFGKVFKESFLALLSPIIILGSIYGGITSPTEAAAFSVLYSIIISVFIYRTIKIKDLWGILIEGTKTYLNILFILAAATAFSKTMTLLQFPQAISATILSVFSGKVVILLVIAVILLLFGMIMDNVPNIMILTPILLPVAKSVGISSLHFGIIMTTLLAIGMVTPPVGINLFVASNMSGIPAMKIAKSTIPFLISFFIAVLLIIFIPGISTFLPEFGG